MLYTVQGMEGKKNPSLTFLVPARRGQRFMHNHVWPRDAADA